jgi:hypothetical protein
MRRLMTKNNSKPVLTSNFLLLAACSISISGLNLPVYCADGTAALEAKDNQAKLHPMAANQTNNEKDDKQHYQEELTLDHIRDAGLALHEIKTDVIYIFLESTRRPTLKTKKPDIVIPNTISAKDIGEGSSFNPVRSEWLIYYIGILEPIIRLFQNDVNDTRKGYRKLIIPEGTRRLAEPLWRNWSNDVDQLNKHLTQLNELIEETGKTDNAAIAKEAVAMFDIAQQMEKNRRKGYNLVRNFEIKRKVLTKTEL